jgi:hypothetical protein
MNQAPTNFLLHFIIDAGVVECVAGRVDVKASALSTSPLRFFLRVASRRLVAVIAAWKLSRLGAAFKNLVDFSIQKLARCDFGVATDADGSSFFS